MLNKAPTLWTLRRLCNEAEFGENSVEIGGKWYPARPLGYYSLRSRIRIAWLVFTGKCDAVIWPQDDEDYNETKT